MSNLDRSLDDILASKKANRRHANKGGSGGIRKRSERAAAGKANAAITKTQAPSKAAATAAQLVPVPNGKILVSNLVCAALLCVYNLDGY